MGSRKNVWQQKTKIITVKIFRSFGFAWQGLKICFTSETNFRIHVLLGSIAIVLGIVFGMSATEWMAVILCISFVMAMEMLNTAAEKLCDVVHKGTHPGIKAVKDIAAGGVLIAAAGSLITGLIIFLPKIIAYLKSI